MPFFISPVTQSKSAYESRVTRIAALAYSVFGTYGKPMGEVETDRVNDLLAKAEKADEVVFASHSKKAAAAGVANHWRIGLATDGAGETKMALAIERQGETIVADFNVDEALGVALWLCNRVSDLNDLGELSITERKGLATLLNAAGRFANDLTGVTKRMEDEYREQYKRSSDARTHAALVGLERQAEEAVNRKYESAIRSLSMAAGMPNGAEKAALIQETAQIVRRAFGNG